MSIRSEQFRAERVWAELSALVSCTSPDGSAELAQVRFLQEQLVAARRVIKILNPKIDVDDVIRAAMSNTASTRTK